MSEPRDATSQILAYLGGEIGRPTFAELGEAEREAAMRELSILEEVLKADPDMIPAFNEDPVAVRLGFRDGPEEARVFGPAIKIRREALALSMRDMARVISGTGHTVSAEWIAELEDGTWHTLRAELVTVIAEVLGVSPGFLSGPPVTGAPMDQVALELIREHDQLSVSRFHEPFAEQFNQRLLVAFLDLRILLIVCQNDQDRIAAVDFATRSIFDADRFAAIGAVMVDSEFTTWLVKPSDALSHYEVPSGTHVTNPRLRPAGLSLVIGDIVQKEVIRWPRFDVELTVPLEAEVSELRTEVSNESLKKFKASASRVAIDRRAEFQRVGEREINKIKRLIDALLTGTTEEISATTVLDSVEQVS